MSLNTFTTLIVPKDTAAEQFGLLFQRLLTRGEVTHITISGFRSIVNAKGQRCVDFTVFDRLEPMDSTTRIIELASPIVCSDKELNVDFRLHLRSGRMIRAELVLHGLNDRFGVAQTEGNIHVRIPHKELCPQFTPTERDLDLVASYMKGHMPDDSLEWVPDVINGIPEQELESQMAAFREIEDVFFLIAGCQEVSQPKPACMSTVMVGHTYLAPETASMIHHFRPAEYARDFARIYATHHWGVRYPMAFGPDVTLDYLEACTSRLEACASTCYRPPGSTDREVLIDEASPTGLPPVAEQRKRFAFLDSLDRTAVEELGQLSDGDARDLLVYASGDSVIETHDFGECGVALTNTPPYGMLWPAYANMYNAFRQG